MNKKGGIIAQLLVLLIAVALVSAGMLLLIKFDILKVKGASSESVLNTEFLPMGRQGILVIKEVEFCDFIDENLECSVLKDEFEQGDNIYVRFVIDTTVVDGAVIAKRNYRILDSSDKVVLQVDEANSLEYEQQTENDLQEIVFADYFTSDEFIPGKHTVEIIIENPLISKRIISTQYFTLLEAVDEAEELQ